MTKQHDRCAENLVEARAEVQSLHALLSETEFSCNHIIQEVKRRYQREMERALDDDQMLVSYIKLFLVPFVVEGYLWLMLVIAIMFLWLIGYCAVKNRFQTFLGIRRGVQYRYGVNFRTRYR